MNQSIKLQKVIENMKKEGVTTYLVSPSPNMNYLTGYGAGPDERLLILAISDTKEPFIVANSMYIPQLKDSGIKQQFPWKDAIQPVELLMEKLSTLGFDTSVVAIENNMAAKFLVPIMNELKDSKFVLGNSLILPLRMFKSEEERKALAYAAKMADESIGTLFDKGAYWIGKTEKEFAAELIFELNKRGMTTTGTPIVAVGKNAAIAHHHTGTTKIEWDTNLLVDFGASFKGYFADMTRNAYFGTPTEKYLEVYQIVHEANLLGEEKATCGTPIEEVDKATRDYITEKGYGEYFIHRTGHGIGLEVHENPYMVQGDTTPLAPGMSFSVEPGIYLEGEFGVRVEDIVLITEEGNKILNQYPKTLKIIEK